MCWELKHLFNGNDQIETRKKKKIEEKLGRMILNPLNYFQFKVLLGISCYRKSSLKPSTSTYMIKKILNPQKKKILNLLSMCYFIYKNTYVLNVININKCHFNNIIIKY